jgi:hypothetical protein
VGATRMVDPVPSAQLLLRLTTTLPNVASCILFGVSGPRLSRYHSKASRESIPLEDNVDATDPKVGGSNRCTGRPVQPGA